MGNFAVAKNINSIMRKCTTISLKSLEKRLTYILLCKVKKIICFVYANDFNNDLQTFEALLTLPKLFTAGTIAALEYYMR